MHQVLRSLWRIWNSQQQNYQVPHFNGSRNLFLKPLNLWKLTVQVLHNNWMHCKITSRLYKLESCLLSQSNFYKLHSCIAHFAQCFFNWFVSLIKKMQCKTNGPIKLEFDWMRTVHSPRSTFISLRISTATHLNACILVLITRNSPPERTKREYEHI